MSRLKQGRAHLSERFHTDHGKRLRELDAQITALSAERRQRVIAAVEDDWPILWVSEASGISRPTIYDWAGR